MANSSPFNVTPLVITTNLLPALEKRQLVNQIERLGKKGQQNVGFVNASFEAMMRNIGWQGGQPWCAYYIKLVLMQLYSFDRAYISKNIGAGAVRNFTTVQELNAKNNFTYRAFTDSNWQVGDIFALKSLKRSGGHTGIVLEALGDGRVKTIEGNTNLAGSREGERVLSQKRNLGKAGTIDQGFRTVGGFRRVFTESEAKRLTFDEDNLTFIFRDPLPTTKPVASAPPFQTPSITDNIKKFLGL